MKPSIARSVFLALSLATAAAASADERHDRIAADRAAAHAELAAQERECVKQFVASPCLDAAREKHRSTVARLRQEEIELDEAQRQAAAVARRDEIARKVQAQASRASEASSQARPARAPTPSRVEPVAPRPLGSRPARPGPAARPLPKGASIPSDRAAAERQNEAEFDARTKAAQAHRETIDKRNAQRAAEGKVVAPLPPVPLASAPQ